MDDNFTLLADYDEYGWPDLLNGSDLLDIVRLDAKRLAEYPQFGDLLIKRTSNGYHLVTPDAKLTKREWELALILLHCDSGYRWWSIQHGRATLRISDKVVVKMKKQETFSRKTLRDRPRDLEVVPNRRR